MQNHTFSTKTTEQTQSFGKRLGTILKSRPPDHAGAFVIALHGDLGAGKTTLTQGIAAGLGVTQTVTSPTYTIINEYALAHDLLLAHVDSYRLADAQNEQAQAAALGIGLDELIDDDRTILIIEWASYLTDLLPTDHLAFKLEHDTEQPDARQITIRASGPRSQAFLDALAS